MKKKDTKKQINPALKYSGMVAQMATAIFLGMYLGKKIDAYLELRKPYFMLLLIIVFLTSIFYVIIKQLNEDS